MTKRLPLYLYKVNLLWRMINNLIMDGFTPGMVEIVLGNNFQSKSFFDSSTSRQIIWGWLPELRPACGDCPGTFAGAMVCNLELIIDNTVITTINYLGWLWKAIEHDSGRRDCKLETKYYHRILSFANTRWKLHSLIKDFRKAIRNYCYICYQVNYVWLWHYCSCLPRRRRVHEHWHQEGSGTSILDNSSYTISPAKSRSTLIIPRPR